MSLLALAKWEPDKFGTANTGQTDARNIYALGTGYAPVKDILANSLTGLDAMALGALSAQDNDGDIATFAGDVGKLYKLSAGAFSDVSRDDGYTVPVKERWDCAQFGPFVLFTQIGDPPQKFELGSDSAFADLGGSPPQARHIAVVRDFVVLSNTTNSPNEVIWSGFNDAEGWDAGVNQSDSQTLQGGGPVQTITGGEVGYVFQERAITRMSYVGPPVYFQFDAIELARGLAAPGAIIKVGSLIYYLAQDGFYRFDGTGSVPIGNQRVDAWFAAHLQPSTSWQITGGADPSGKFIYWCFVSTDSTLGSHPDTVLIYNWAADEWTYAKINLEMLFPALTSGVTLEEIGDVYDHIEDVPVSLDSRQWSGGSAFLAGFDTTHNLGSLDGDTLEAKVTTGDFEGVASRRSMVTNLRPLTDASAMMAICESRERLSDAAADTNSAAMQSNGDIPLMSSGRYHRIGLTIPAATVWSFMNGVDVDASDDGAQ